MSSKTAIKILLGVLIVVVLFHLGVLFKFIPYDIAWGYRLTKDSEMYFFAGVSTTLNLFFIGLLLINGNFLKAFIPKKTTMVILWIFLGLFILKTIGNILAKTTFEKYFAIVTLAFAILLWVVLRKKKSQW
jgi:hypothetical protein